MADSHQETLARMKKKKPNITLPAKVEKIIPANYEPEKAQIAIASADLLYREIRVENALSDEQGEKVKLKAGDEVDVTIEADPQAISNHENG